MPHSVNTPPPLASLTAHQCLGNHQYQYHSLPLFCSDFDKTKYVEVGDGRVTEGAPCRRCPLPDGRRRRHLLSRLGRREARQSPQPHDGPLAADAEYAAFVQLVGTERLSVSLDQSGDMVDRSANSW